MNGRARHALQLVSLFGRGHESLENVCECSYLILIFPFRFLSTIIIFEKRFFKESLSRDQQFQKAYLYSKSYEKLNRNNKSVKTKSYSCGSRGLMLTATGTLPSDVGKMSTHSCNFPCESVKVAVTKRAVSTVMPLENRRNIVGCYMLRPVAHPVACCWVLLGVVAQTLKPVKLLATCKRTQLPTFVVVSVCIWFKTPIISPGLIQ